jgi:fumarate hydratase class II
MITTHPASTVGEAVSLSGKQTVSPTRNAIQTNGEFRVESDSLGEIKVPADRIWGAQTQRSLSISVSAKI